MDTNLILGLMATIGRSVALILSIIVLVDQIREIRTHKSLKPFRWTLLVLNVFAILAYIAPGLIIGLIRLTTGGISDAMMIGASLLINIFALGFSICLFLIYRVFNRGKP